MFPFDEHDENAWSKRLHIPLQIGLSKVATAARRAALLKASRHVR